MQKMMSLLRRCVEDYNMIRPGDNIAVGLSGGKDSLVLLTALAGMRGFYPDRYTLKAVTLDLGFEGTDLTPISGYCKMLGIEYIIKKTNIADVVFNIKREPNPCSLCAKLRRGMLNTAALECGCDKVALGHHRDDAVETFLMSLLYEGRIGCFSPVSYLDRSGITLIRPLLYATERDVRGLARRLELPVAFNPCPANGATKRQEAKEFLSAMSQSRKNIKDLIFGALQRSELPGWRPAPRKRREKDA